MKKIQYRGKEQSLGKWCKELGLNYYKTYQRINTLGYSVEEAFEKGTDVGKRKKVMIINDLHLPYVHPDLLGEIEKHKDIDELLIAGDMADCMSCSSFPHLEDVSLEEELVVVHEYVKKINDILGNKPIHAILGNHCLRLEREISKMHKKDLARFIDHQFLRMISDGFTLFTSDGKKKQYEGFENFNYYHKWSKKFYNNLMISHPQSFSGVPAKTLEDTITFFLNSGEVERGDIVLIGHTHHYSQLISSRRQGIFGIENGTCAIPMGYADTGRLGYTPQTNCYTIVEFIEGEKINLNDVKTYFFGD